MEALMRFRMFSIGMTALLALMLAGTAEAAKKQAVLPTVESDATMEDGAVPIDEVASFCREQTSPGEGCQAILATVRTDAGRKVAAGPKRGVGQALRINTIVCQSYLCLGTPDRDDITGRPVAGTKIEAKAANDIVTGGQGDDIVNGEGGDDDIRAGEGADTNAGNGSADAIFGQGGWDRAKSGGSNYVLGVLGSDGWDDLDGGEGNDFISGGIGNDDMAGAEGDDILIGTGDGGDPDTLNGGGGNDDCDPGVNDTVSNC